jgi:hypothetical protein
MANGRHFIMTEIADEAEMDRVSALHGTHRHALRAISATERIAKLQALRAAVVAHHREHPTLWPQI